MKRGEIWTAAGRRDYAGKPRPIVIVQDDLFAELQSVTFCGFTTNMTDAPAFRPPVEPTPSNGLRAPCRLMADKLMTIPRSKIGSRIGRLDEDDLLRLNRAILVFLGLAASPRTG